MENYIGKLLDNRYEIQEVIGTGGMAVVFKAQCHLLNRPVAIKVLKSDLADDADFRRRFHDEAQAVAQLSHPNIVAVYDVSRGGEMEYLVMELIDGITLKQYMARRGKLNWQECLHFITQVMKGLSHAHSRGIVHRDIKPHNIMILRDGSVKVADFGIACLVANGQDGDGQETLGSVHYISPEQAKGERTDERSDIYSAGVVLYEMLTDRLPFEGETPVSVAIQHFSAVPLRPREIDPEIPEALEKICMKAMAPGLDQRYGSADEMLRDLEEFRKNPEVELAYDLSELRVQVTDEPTQNIKAKELHSTAERRYRYEDEDAPMAGWKKLLLALAVLAVGIGMVYGLYQFILASFAREPVPEYIVPDVMGHTIEEAMALPEVAGVFTIEEVGGRPSEEYPVGVILEQDPKAETVRKSDLTISVVVSQGGKSVAMPPLAGVPWDVAEQILKNLKMDLNIVIQEERYHDTMEAGKVIIATPLENELLYRGDTVSLVISKGPKIVPVTVIAFTTKEKDEAAEMARKLGLEPVFEDQADEEYPAGVVVAQSLAPGDSVSPGSKIILYVSTGPETPPETDGPGGEPVEPGEPAEPDSGGAQDDG